ncbi:hypothetical protein P879_11501 [Paragonimus westermani]|uniref:Uncharacterized protein n=1 Tax=Paragonimus westermani TaxID=34504 RepID=A0A8T0D9C1_9TREM|nr:hypothetical protein P879_11501 [Paragonimus westermani]
MSSTRHSSAFTCSSPPFTCQHDYTLRITCLFCMTVTTGTAPITTISGSAYECSVQTKFILVGSTITTGLKGF